MSKQAPKSPKRTAKQAPKEAIGYVGIGSKEQDGKGKKGTDEKYANKRKRTSTTTKNMDG